MGCLALLPGICLTQVMNLCVPHWQADSLPPSHVRCDACDWPHLNHDQNPGCKGNLENVTFRVLASAMQ